MAHVKILVIRRDNIGDLVCTTPALAAIRAQIPTARVCALVNSYNAEVLHGNGDVDQVYVYTKLKHRGTQSRASVIAQRMAVAWALRRERFDYAILGGTQFSKHTWRSARWAAPKQVFGYAGAIAPRTGRWLTPPSQPMHEVETLFALLALLGVEGPPPSLTLAPRPIEVERIEECLRVQGLSGIPIALHISARKPSNRWPVAHFVALIHQLYKTYGREFLLLWSPGDAANPHHPGDDRNAAEIVAACSGIPIAACRTDRLEQLIAALSLCDVCICSDGGAMHIAAALKNKILCFFGDSDPARWHPWGVPHVLLQTPTRCAADIGVDQAFAAFNELMRKG